eukprot:6715516-Karenia_brevis.AAC.1
MPTNFTIHCSTGQFDGMSFLILCSNASLVTRMCPVTDWMARSAAPLDWLLFFMAGSLSHLKAILIYPR